MPPRNKALKKSVLKPTSSRSIGPSSRSRTQSQLDVPPSSSLEQGIEQVRSQEERMKRLGRHTNALSPQAGNPVGVSVPEDEITPLESSTPRVRPIDDVRNGTSPTHGSNDYLTRMYNLEKKVSTIEQSMNQRLDDISMHINCSNELVQRALGSKSGYEPSDDGSVSAKKERNKLYVRPMEAYVQVMEQRLPYLDIAFSDYTVPRCVYNIFISKIVDVLSPDLDSIKQEGLSEHCLQILDAISFSVKSDDHKTVFGSSSGKLASIFRKDVMICSLTNARKDMFKVICGGGQSHTRTMPSWLSKRVAGNQPYVSTDHVHLVQKMKESKTDTKSAFKDRARIATQKTATRRDDGTYAMRYLYSAVTRTLTRGRREMAHTFFVLVGFLFVDWKKFPSCKVNDSDVQLTWAAPVQHDGLEVKDIPDATTFSSNDMNMIDKNKHMVEEFSKARKELQLCTEHDVIVLTKRGRNRAHVPSNGHPKSWRRAISLMNVVIVLVHKICGFDCTTSIHEMVGYHRKSLVAMYILALSFRQMLQSRDTRCVLGDDGTNSELTLSEQVNRNSSLSTDPCSPALDRDCLDKLWDMLVPTPNAQDEMLRKCTCQVLESQYNAEMIRSSSDVHANEDPDDDDVLDLVDDGEVVHDGELSNVGGEETYDW